METHMYIGKKATKTVCFANAKGGGPRGNYRNSRKAYFWHNKSNFKKKFKLDIFILKITSKCTMQRHKQLYVTLLVGTTKKQSSQRQVNKRLKRFPLRSIHVSP